MKVIYTQWGLANYYGDYIEINEGLKEDKKLRDYVIKHELGHSQEFDLKHEFDIKPQLFKLIGFLILHPKTWIDFSPIQYRKKQLVYDTNIMMLYGIIVILSLILYAILI